MSEVNIISDSFYPSESKFSFSHYFDIMTFIPFYLALRPRHRSLELNLQNATSTSLKIGWKSSLETPFGNQSLIIISYNRLINCKKVDLSKSNSLFYPDICDNDQIANVSQVLDYNTTSLTIKSLLPNSTYQINVKLQSLAFTNVIATGGAVFHTSYFSEYNRIYQFYSQKS